MSLAAAPAPTPVRDLARKLWGAGLVRGVIALVVGATALSQSPCSAVLVARAIAAYWLVEGLVALWASRVLATLALNRTLVVLRGAIAIAGALTIFALPLESAVGSWQPGQLLMRILIASLLLLVIALQMVAGALDVVMCRQVRRRLPGEWSAAFAAALSVALGIVMASMFVVPPALSGYFLAAVAGAVGIGILLGVARLRRRGEPSSLPTDSSKK
jgi:uncharacterized membrane protein HdeD (DUF308 family)